MSKFLFFIFIFLFSSVFNFTLANNNHHNHDSSIQKKMFSMEFIKYENGKMFVKILKNGSPADLKDFKNVHENEVHIFTISENLEQYSHIHPLKESERGIYSFYWKNNKTSNFRVWADLVDKKTGIQEYTSFETKNSDKKQNIVKKEVLEEVKNNINFSVSFDKKIVSGNNLTMKVKISTQENKPFTSLEKVMGEYAHVVAFSGNNENIVHIHPINADLKNGEIFFHVNFPKKDFVKLFVQVKINGEDYFIPFGFFVK